MGKWDAILIPGGGLREGGQLPPWTKRRLDRAIERQTEEFLVVLSAGTVHKPPPLDERGFPIFESAAAADYLAQHGVHPQMILPETCSYDTIGNAFFSRVIHADPMGFKRLLVITSEFHMPRAREIFEWIYGIESPPGGHELSFESVSDEGIPPDVLAARVEKERQSLQRVVDLRARIRTLRRLHQWLFAEHSAYSVHSQPARLTGKILDTY